jgi:hypothetical protein
VDYRARLLLANFQRGAKRIVERVFSKVEVGQQADQGREDSARLRAINLVNAFTYLIGCVLSHCDRPYAWFNSLLFHHAPTAISRSPNLPAGKQLSFDWRMGPVASFVDLVRQSF